MRLLLDTHAFIWWVNGNTKLSKVARDAIEDDAIEVWVSAICAFEIATKYTLGKMPEVESLIDRFEHQIEIESFRTLDVSTIDGIAAGRLPLLHRDPFDRLIVAQAMTRSMTLVSNERLFDAYGVSRLW